MTPEAAPIPAATAIIAGSRRVSSEAEAAGVTNIASINAIPAWLVIDGNGRVIDEDTGSPGRHNLRAAQAFLSDLSMN